MTHHLILKKDEISLYLIDLPQKKAGFSNFISSWLIKNDRSKEDILIDCGPASTIGLLVEELSKLKVNLKKLLLTHIHLDHGGGAGQLCRLFPAMSIKVHERGKKHLISPSRLWQGSLDTLGDLALLYGKPEPIDKNRFLGDLDDFYTIDTPGHSGHHLSFKTDLKGIKVIFSGETTGVSVEKMIDRWQLTGRDRPLYIRPATPKPFKLDITLSSIDKIDEEVDLFCPGHYGPVEDRSLPTKARQQLRTWESIIKSSIGSGITDLKQLSLEVIKKDEQLRPIDTFKDDVKRRELYFIENSLRGFLDYFDIERKGKDLTWKSQQ